MGLREVFEDPRTTTRDAALLAQRARVTLKVFHEEVDLTGGHGRTAAGGRRKC